ncbi:MAG: adenylate/guanylate cyclase domain-containing protein [Clostridiales bacterium]|nr:adenylate/guanylate cyclase domain-containing protein [Clostridiales bacterium]
MTKKLMPVIEALIVGIIVFLLTLTNLFSPLDYIVRDRLYQVPRGIRSDIKIIGIDAKTLEEYGPIQTWSRDVYANLIDILNVDENTKPYVIGFDIQFSGNVDEGDRALVDAAEEYGNVVVVSQLIYSKKWETNDQGITYYPVEGIVLPYEELLNVTSTGYSNVSLDSDGIVRRIIPAETYDGVMYQTFSKVMYDKYCATLGLTPNEVPTDITGRSIINYSGKPGDYEYISLADVLDGKMDPRIFSDSVVFVGAYAPSMQDDFVVPNGGSSQMYGVEIHANIFQSYLQGRFAVNGDTYILSLVTALLAMVIHLLFRKLKTWQSVILLIASAGIEIAVLVAINNNGYSFSVIYFPLMIFLSFIYSLGINYLLETRRKKKVLNAFRKYVAPQIVEEIAKKGDFEIKVGGENRDIAVLFVDIRGFTTMSEALEPEQVVEILNEYLTLTTKSIFDNSGTLDKFVGDATMAVFNSPFDLEDYEYKAVCAAMDIVKGGEAIEEKFQKRFGRSVGFGVGVNCGPAVVGNVGCEFRMDFTAIGDTVNTAARLEANAKKGQVLISDVLYERLKDRLEVRDVGEIPLKGKTKGVFVYEVTKIIGRD